MASWKTWLAAVASLSTGLAGCSGGGGGGDPAGVCLPGQQQACYAGPAGTAGVGRCAAGSQPCVGGQWGACAGAVLPTAEACNGVDDDCDGAADQGDPGGGSSCATGLAGRCDRGVLHCQAGATACVPAVLPGALPETCNGLDDDCDGTVDEGCSCLDGQQQGCYSGPAGTAGVGRCAAGSQTCAIGQWGPCAGEELPVAETCNGLDDDCSGAADDGLAAPPNANQLGACQGTLQACTGAGGWVDAYAGAPGYGLPETPDASYADENCDGLDGDLALAVFVSAAGTDGGPCTMAAPCATLPYALAAAAAAGRPHVYLQAGSYVGNVELRDGVSIFGGYAVDWSRGPGNQVSLIGGGAGAGGEYVAVRASGVTATLADLRVVAPNASGQDALGRGRSSHGVYASSSTVTLRRVFVLQGAGANGLAGRSGTPASGTPALPGDVGAPSESSVAVCDATTRGAGGAGGIGSCGGVVTSGGAGGGGGTMDTSCAIPNDLAARPGDAGVDGLGPVGGGFGGPAGPVCTNGSSGQPGANGLAGAGGAGAGGGGLLVGGFWYGQSGGAGAPGGPGHGGGGGGGGGGCDTGVDAWGAGGGGGGAGGCGAPAGGEGGASGGGSFGLFGVGSALVVEGCTFQLGQGGGGGPGGLGAFGQAGGQGKAGGGLASGAGFGGTGGAGGSGGPGGGGGGGAGGWVAGILTSGGSLQLSSSTFAGGVAGPGGSGGTPALGGTTPPGNFGDTGATGRLADTMTCASPDGC
ncbi:MAG: putative metal-binding motif-containing protein [Anaeromyxobacter sp.]|nr:putative metal-binding motif-containing protein [Anaeromyxobacter sp.]